MLPLSSSEGRIVLTKQSADCFCVAFNKTLQTSEVLITFFYEAVYLKKRSFIRQNICMELCHCGLQVCKCVIHLVTSPWFPIITVMNLLLLGNHCCNTFCRAVKRLYLKIGVRCSSTLSLWQRRGFLKWFHHMMTWWPNASSTKTSATCWQVCMCVRSEILKTEMYQPGDGSTKSAVCTSFELDPFSGKRRMMVMFSTVFNVDMC